MFEKVNVPILGIVENMSYFVTPNGERVEIFRPRRRQEAEAAGTAEHLHSSANSPCSRQIREGGDAGIPVVASDSGGSDQSRGFITLGTGLA